MGAAGVGDALVRAVSVGELPGLAQSVGQVALVQIKVRSGSSRRQVRTRLSMIGFTLGI